MDAMKAQSSFCTLLVVMALALSSSLLGCAGTPRNPEGVAVAAQDRPAATQAPAAVAGVTAAPAPSAAPSAKPKSKRSKPVMSPPPALEARNFPVTGAMADLTAHEAVRQMGLGINIGNTLENTTGWETGWGQPLITREFIHALAAHGYGVVRLPVAWDTYAVDGVVQEDKFARVEEVVGWILAEGMFCVVNIHWDGGWIDSGDINRFPGTHHTFSPEAEQKFRSYWTQIATRFARYNERLVFEGLNEETNFTNEGGTQGAYDTLVKVNQLFIDTVRQTGGNNAGRLLVVAGYSTDFAATADSRYFLPEDKAKDRLMVSVHYYTPSTFAILEKDASWGKVANTWGSRNEVLQLEDLFGRMYRFSQNSGVPVFVGEYGLPSKKDQASRVRWYTAVTLACLKNGFVPVLWDVGNEIDRRKPWGMSLDMVEVFKQIRAFRDQGAAAK